MDEPMEEVVGKNGYKLGLDGNPNRILPGSSVVMVNMCQEDYDVHYWPKLKEAIENLLTLSPGEYVPISYEQMYSCVYKCVCRQFSDRLYADLLDYVERRLSTVSNELHNVDPSVYIVKFEAAMTQYEQALGGIVPIFNYMNRFYVENKLHTDLKAELLRIFTVTVAEHHISKLIPCLEDAQMKPFHVSPSVMASIVKGLYALKPEYAQLSPLLFAKFIPNILPATTEADLPQYMAEVQHIQQQLIEEGFQRGDQSRKRQGENDVPRPPVLNSSATNQNAINHNKEVGVV